MTKALKLRLQKLVHSVKDEDIVELWDEFKRHMKNKETAYVRHNFKIGDEVSWVNGSGTIVEILADKCKIRQGYFFWKVSGILLTREKTLKV